MVDQEACAEVTAPPPSPYMARCQRYNPAMTTTMLQPQRKMGPVKKKKKKGWKHNGSNVWRGGKSGRVAAGRFFFFGLNALRRLVSLAQIEPANQANARLRGYYLAPAQVCMCVVSGVPIREDGCAALRNE